MFALLLVLLLMAPLLAWLVGNDALRAEIRRGYPLYYAGVLFASLFFLATR